MKKNVIIGVLILCLFPFMSAALSAEIGIKGGLNVSSLDFHDYGHDWDFDWNGGFQVGLFFTVPLSRSLVFQPELHYGMRDWWNNRWDEKGNRYWKLGYFELPLLLKYKLTRGNRITPTIFAGPYASVKLSAGEIDGEWDHHWDNIEVRVKDAFWGMVIGGSLDIDLGSINLILETRYNIPFEDDNDYRHWDNSRRGHRDGRRRNALICMIGFSF